MLQNAPDCTIPPKKNWGSMPPNPLANAWLRHASQAPPPKKKIVGPLGKSCIRP